MAATVRPAGCFSDEVSEGKLRGEHRYKLGLGGNVKTSGISSGLFARRRAECDSAVCWQRICAARVLRRRRRHGRQCLDRGKATSAQWPPNPPPPPANIVTLPVKAPPPAPVPYWWTHGEIEFGGRGFLNDPNQSGSIWGDTNPANTTTGGYAYLGQKSLGKFYEYGIENPSPFGGGHVAAGTSDGLYQIDLWANNIASNFAGFSDQAYLLQASKVGEHYFWFSWDQTPHIYSTSAQTPFLGVGSNNLTLPAVAGSEPPYRSNSPARQRE